MGANHIWPLNSTWNLPVICDNCRAEIVLRTEDMRFRIEKGATQREVSERDVLFAACPQCLAEVEVSRVLVPKDLRRVLKVAYLEKQNAPKREAMERKKAERARKKVLADLRRKNAEERLAKLKKAIAKAEGIKGTPDADEKRWRRELLAERAFAKEAAARKRKEKE